MVKFTNAIDWNRLEDSFDKNYCLDNESLAINTRLMVALPYLIWTEKNVDTNYSSGKIYQISYRCEAPL